MTDDSSIVAPGHGFAKSGQHCLDFVELTQESDRNVGLDEAEVMSEGHLTLEFVGRARSDSDEPEKFVCRVPTASFGDVRTDGNYRATCLRLKSETLRAGKRPSRFIHSHGQLPCFLPNNEFAIILHPTRVRRIAREGNTLPNVSRPNCHLSSVICHLSAPSETGNPK